MLCRTRRSLVLAAALPLALAAQQPLPLPAVDATYSEPFTLISGVRELSNGRVLVADARDKTVQLVDLKAGSASKIGREGSGPGEFSLPFRLYAAGADTTLLFDPGNSRYLLIGPDGKPGSDFRIDAGPTRAGGGMVRVGFSMARSSDLRGRLYWEAPVTMESPDGMPRMADSAALLRYDRATKKTDTLAFVKLQKNNMQTSGSGGNVRVMMGAANPLTPRDEWSVFPDGRVVIIRAEPYRVDWVMASGAKGKGPSIASSPLRITDADKKEEEALRRRQSNSGLRMMVSDGPNGRQMSASVGGQGGPQMDLPPLADWPAMKPPFRAGQPSIWARPNGELWVRRTEAAGAKGTLYDVINPEGMVTHQMRVAEGVTVVGFGNGTVYTTKADADDLLYLQRHRMP